MRERLIRFQPADSRMATQSSLALRIRGQGLAPWVNCTFRRAKPVLYSGCVRVLAVISEAPEMQPTATLGGAPSHSINVRQSPLPASTTGFAHAKFA